MSSKLWDKPIREIITPLLKIITFIFKYLLLVLYWLVISTAPIYLLFKWQFEYINEINTFFGYAIWPLTIILLVLLFRESIKDLLRNMKRAKTMFGDLEFDNIEKQQVESREENKESLEEIERLKGEKLDFGLKYHFEKTYRLIFGSQLGIISTMSNDSNKKISETLARGFHKNSTSYSVYPFEQYIGFLINMGLIQYLPEEKAYILTLLGSRFVDYLNSENMIFNKNPF